MRRECALRDIKRAHRRQFKFFEKRAKQSREWMRDRDGCAGRAAGPVKRLDPQTGALIEIVPSSDG